MKPQENSATVRILEQHARDSQDEYQKLLYTVSHDMAAPLRSIVAFSKLLKESAAEKLDEKELRYLSFMISGGEKAQSMFAGLLEHSRLVTRAGEHEMVDANNIVKECLAELQETIQKKGAVVQVDKLPVIRGEAGQLKKLFTALIDNAVKYSQQDLRPHVLISADRYGKGWRFSVRDNGIGIESSHADNIFNIFSRLHTDTEYPGIGMGLALSKRIMELHNGDIWVKSMPGKGATFYFFFPNITELESV